MWIGWTTKNCFSPELGAVLDSPTPTNYYAEPPDLIYDQHALYYYLHTSITLGHHYPHNLIIIIQSDGIPTEITSGCLCWH